MFGIIDVRHKKKDILGILRGKSRSIENAFKKRKTIFSHLTKYEKQPPNNTDLQITKLIGVIRLGDTVECNQTAGLIIVVT